MNTNLQVFNFESHSIRTVEINGVVWFSSRDVALTLGYVDPSQAYRAHCKSLKLLSYVECTELNWLNPNNRGEYVMPESDVYRLIIKSEKPQAEKFEKWIMEEVLPTIRKTGSYSISNNAVQQITLTQHEIAVKQFEGECKIAVLLECPIHIAQQEIVKSVRKATGIDFEHLLKNAAAQQNILPQDVMLEPTEIGIRLGLGSGKVVNQLLLIHGFQTRINGEWVPTILGEPHCQKHAWVNTNKSGYNLKWSLNFIENNITSDED